MADVTVNVFPEGLPDAGVGSWPIADTVELFVGSLVGIEGGYLNHWADGANDIFAGRLMGGDARAQGTALLGNTSDDIPPEGRVDTSGYTYRNLASVGGTPTQAKVGDPIYCTSSNTDDMTLTVGSHLRAIGWLSRFRTATDVDVKLFPISHFAERSDFGGIVSLTNSTGGTANDTVADSFTQGTAFTDNTTGTTTATLAAGVGTYLLTIPIALAGITGNVDVMTDYILGHKFKVLSMRWITTTVASTAAKAATLTADIGATPITSITLTLDSDDSTTTTLGGVLTVDATAANTGSATDTLSIVAASVTAFVEGSGCIQFEIQNMDTADAFAGLVTQANLARTDATTGNDNDADLADKVNEILATG